MWALLAIALIGAATAVPTNPALTYHFQLQSKRNDLMSDQLTSQFQEQLKKRCQRYGDSDSYDNFINERNKIVREIQGAALQEVTQYVESGENPDYVKIFCNLSPTLKRSSRSLTSAMKPCTKPQNREELGFLNNVTDSFLDYVCYNNGQRVKSFINEGGIECLTEKQAGLRQCAESAISEEDNKTESENNIFGSDESLDKEEKEKRLADDCREASILEGCIKGELNQCSNRTASTFLIGLLDSVLQPMCQKYWN